MAFIDDSPPPQEILEMEPEALAPIILRHLQQQPANRNSINRYNFSLPPSSTLYQNLTHGQQLEYGKRLMEAWMYLERQGFVAPMPGTQDGWAFVTRKGQAIVTEQDFDTYQQAHLLPVETTDPVLLHKVKQSFIVGDYETAIFQAFKEVEVRVRDKAKLPTTDIGVDLMRKAFHTQTGPLTESLMDPGEKEARQHLFAGAIGSFKNPPSHRNVVLNAKEAADIIRIANELLRIVDSLP